MAAASCNANQSFIQKTIRENKVVVFSKSWCPYCSKVKDLFRCLKWDFKTIELDKECNGSEIQRELEKLTGQCTVPNVFVGGTHVGGCDDTFSAHSEGRLLRLYNNCC